MDDNMLESRLTKARWDAFDAGNTALVDTIDDALAMLDRVDDLEERVSSAESAQDSAESALHELEAEFQEYKEEMQEKIEAMHETGRELEYYSVVSGMAA